MIKSKWIVSSWLLTSTLNLDLLFLNTVNKIPVDIIPRSTRGKAGTKVIKLSKDDEVKNIIPCKPNQSIVVYEGGRTNTTIDVDKLDIGSTISPGIKLLKNPLRVHVINN